MSLQKSSSLEKSIAIVGATGAVGEQLLRVLERRNFPVDSLRLLASPRSVRVELAFGERMVPVEVLREGSFDGIDIAFFCAGGEISKKFAPHAVKAGAVVIDNSSAFRMDSQVPLIVPEINPDDVKHHHGIIANPNCSTAIALMALAPLHRSFGLKRVIASTYQAVSGTGARAIEELRGQVESISRGEAIQKEVYPHQIAFNLLPHVDTFLENGYTKEEMKFQNESRKILHLPDLQTSMTCVRVPVYRAHSIALHAEFKKTVSVKAAQDALIAATGIDLVDDPNQALYPMPLEVQGLDQCHVGRLRIDTALPNALAFWICGDQLLKGAALNAVQIAELLV